MRRIPRAAYAQVHDPLRRHDNDHDGYITTRELRHALRELNLQVDTDQALKILYEFDQNDDGKLDLNEFGILLRKRDPRDSLNRRGESTFRLDACAHSKAHQV